jgi:hypothetical protein
MRITCPELSDVPSDDRVTDPKTLPQAGADAPKRRALLVLFGAAGLMPVVQWAFRRLASDDATPGLAIHEHPRELPMLRFLDGAGASTSLAAFRGRVVLLNVWATWCAPCVKEMPALDRLQALLGGPDFNCAGSRPPPRRRVGVDEANDAHGDRRRHLPGGRVDHADRVGRRQAAARRFVQDGKKRVVRVA